MSMKKKERVYKLTSTQAKKAKTLVKQGKTTLDALQTGLRKAGMPASRKSISNWRIKTETGKRSVFAEKVRALGILEPDKTYKQRVRSIAERPEYAKKRSWKTKGWQGGYARVKEMQKRREALYEEMPGMNRKDTKDRAFDAMEDEGASFGDTPH